MSYMMQNALALYAWLLLWLFSWGEYANASRRRGRVTLPAGFGRFLDRMEQGNLTNATRTFLVEFHEAECFFIMAISIAILYANSQGAIFNGVENWQSLINTRKSIVTLASTGAMPIVLTQLSLRHSRINSFYCLFLSIVSLLLVGLAADTGLKPDADSVYDMFKDENNLIDCGNHPSLRTFCLSDGSYATTSAYFQLATLLAYFALISMIVLKIIHGLSERGWVLKHKWLTQSRNSSSGRGSKVRSCTKKLATHLANVTILIAEAWVLVYTYMNIATTYSSLREPDVDTSTITWNVGQVIAVLIWAPIICKYLYLISR